LQQKIIKLALTAKKLEALRGFAQEEELSLSGNGFSQVFHIASGKKSIKTTVTMNIFIHNQSVSRWSRKDLPEPLIFRSRYSHPLYNSTASC
jgi:hypothetical protein